MYKKAAQIKLRIPTTVGMVTVEQAMTLSLQNLANSLKALAEKFTSNEQSSKLSFLDEKEEIDPILELSFNILKDIYMEKKTAIETAEKAREVKEHNEKIMARIAALKERELDEMSEKELMELLK